MEIRAQSWNMWMLGALFTIAIILGRLLVAGVDARVGVLETKQDASSQRDADMRVQVGQLQVQLQTMNQKIDDIKAATLVQSNKLDTMILGTHDVRK